MANPWAGEVAIRIAPDRMTSWDYSERMADAVGATRRQEGVPS